jgi:hypothetical protein
MCNWKFKFDMQISNCNAASVFNRTSLLLYLVMQMRTAHDNERATQIRVLPQLFPPEKSAGLVLGPERYCGTKAIRTQLTEGRRATSIQGFDEN